MNDEPTDVLDVVIVGGGLSGLSAAYKLFKILGADFKVKILEARDEVGGRLKSTTLPAASGEDKWDVGGQWVCQSQPRVLRLLREMDMQTFPQYSTGQKVTLYKHPDNVLRYEGLIPPLDMLDMVHYYYVERKINCMVKDCFEDDFYQSEKFNEWDSESLQTFMDKHNYFCNGMNYMFSCMTRVVFGCEPSQVSLLYFLYVCASANGMNKLLETIEGSAQELRVKDTAAELPKRLAQVIGLGNVLLNTPIKAIYQTNTEYAELHSDDGRVWKAKHVIVAIPPQYINRILFDPVLPSEKCQINARMPMGHLMKFIATYRTPFWRDKNLSGESTVFSNHYKEETFCCTFDGTTSSGNPAIVGFIGGKDAGYWSSKPLKERRDAVLGRLALLFGLSARIELVHYHDIDWSRQDYVGGCPVAAGQTGALSNFYTAMRKPYLRIHWAGTESAQAWTGYMEGAIEAGERAVDEIFENSQYATSQAAYYDERRPIWPYVAIGVGVVGVGATVIMIKRNSKMKEEFYELHSYLKTYLDIFVRLIKGH